MCFRILPSDMIRSNCYLYQAYRTRLTKEVFSVYFTGEGSEDKVFYKMANLDDRIKNADQLITVDLHRFSTHLAEIYSNLAKPVLDVVLYNVQLSRNIGAEGLILLTLLVQGTAAMCTPIHSCLGFLDDLLRSDLSKFSESPYSLIR